MVVGQRQLDFAQLEAAARYEGGFHRCRGVSSSECCWLLGWEWRTWGLPCGRLSSLASGEGATAAHAAGDPSCRPCPRRRRDHPSVRSFWAVLRGLPLEQKRAFLAFTTGSDRCVGWAWKLCLHGNEQQITRK